VVDRAWKSKASDDVVLQVLVAVTVQQMAQKKKKLYSCLAEIRAASTGIIVWNACEELECQHCTISRSVECVDE
jgi:hypothetical protein